jgi:hypothetical protein
VSRREDREAEKAAELTEMVVTAGANMGSSIDVKDATEVVEQFATIGSPEGHYKLGAKEVELQEREYQEEQEQRRAAVEKFFARMAEEPTQREEKREKERAQIARIIKEIAQDPDKYKPDTTSYYVNKIVEGGGSYYVNKIVEGGGEEAVSIKPFNILLNMRRLIQAITGGVIAFSGVPTMPWLAVVAALFVWCTLYEAATEKLSEKDASVLWTLWVRRDTQNNTIPDAGLLRKVNAERKKYGHTRISPEELKESLDHLVHIKSIERYSEDETRWWLREWVKVTY